MRAAVPLLLLSIAVALPAGATMRYGAIEISGNVESQNLIRHSDVDKYQFVQNRNTFRLRVDWDWLQNGKLIDKISVPFIERSKLFILYRGVYDGFYDIGPTDRQHGQTRFDDLVGGRVTDISNSQLDGIKFENRLREAYIDLKVKDAPVSFRLGRQQVIWGEADQFRLMDIWNPLDVTWHFQQESGGGVGGGGGSWDNIRIPLWLAKGLWDIGDLGPLSNTFLEVVYNPFDFQPGAKVAFLPQPWSLPFPDPLRTGQINNSNGLLVTPQIDLQGTSLKKGDFSRNPQDASEVGTRFHAATPQGLEFSLNYLYGRGRGIGAASPFAVKIDSITFSDSPIVLADNPVGIYQPDINNPAVTQGVIPVNVKAEVVHPYMHIFGLTGNYFEGDYTASVFRFETAYAMGEPFQTVEEDKLVPVCVFNPSTGKRTCPKKTSSAFLGTSPLGFTKRDVWAGMVGFDRQTWIRWLNPKTTWFLTGQFFWSYTTGGHVDDLRGTSGAGEFPYYGPAGKWISGPNAGQVERQQLSGPGVVGNADNVRRWEHLITFAATSFYRGGTIVPFVADAWDPVNDNNEVIWNLDYFYSNDIIITVDQKFFMSYGSKAVSNDPWFAGGRFSRRDETGIKVTYQF